MPALLPFVMLAFSLAVVVVSVAGLWLLLYRLVLCKVPLFREALGLRPLRRRQ